MGIKVFENQPKVTANGGGALTASANDGSGAWNTGIDISAILTTAGYSLPSDATGVIIKVGLNQSFGTGQWAGIRTNGKTAKAVNVNFPTSKSEFFIPFNGSSKLLDFYTSDITHYDFRILGATDSTWTYFDIDAGYPQYAATGGSFQTKTITQVPANASVVADGSNSFCLEKWRPVGTATSSNTHTGTQLFYVDANKQVQFRTNIPTNLIAYTTSGVNWNTWRTVQETYTADSTWRAATYTAAGKKMLVLDFDKSTFVNWTDFRARSSTYNVSAAIPHNSYDEGFFTALDASGQWDYALETGSTGSLWIAASIDDYLNASISSINQLVEGATSTLTFTSPFTPTSASITDSVRTITVTSFSGSSTIWTATCPALTDSTLGIKLGSVSVTATNGSITTASYASSYTKTGYSTVVLTDVSPDSIGQGFTPAEAIGDQYAFDPTKGSISALGVFTSNYTGTQTIWHYSISDFKWRSFSVVTSAGVVIGVSKNTQPTLGIGFGVGI